MKYEDIKKANETILTTDIKGKQYAEVNQRIKAFRMVYPNGTIETEIISQETYRFLNIESNVILMKATIKDDNGKILGTGTAYEKENSTFINKTSFVENAETSAVGRALAMCGFGIDTSIASKEEVENAIAQQEEEKQEQEEKKKLLVDIKILMTKKKVLPNEISETFNKNSADMTNEELEEVKKWLENYEK